MSNVPANPKIYHIVHFDRLASIIETGYLFSDKLTQDKKLAGTNIGMSHIKERRMTNKIKSHPSLCVGECVPFYFCPRSVMLYLLYRGSDELTYRGGQSNIVHLEADLFEAVNWAKANNLKWAFTLSNAGSSYFEDRADLNQLGEINWSAVNTDQWAGRGVSPSIKEGKQSEFLVEEKFPWTLFSRIGIMNNPSLNQRIVKILNDAQHKPAVMFQPGWYY